LKLVCVLSIFTIAVANVEVVLAVTLDVDPAAGIRRIVRRLRSYFPTFPPLILFFPVTGCSVFSSHCL
jgi:hypothetical protein